VAVGFPAECRDLVLQTQQQAVQSEFGPSRVTAKTNGLGVSRQQQLEVQDVPQRPDRIMVRCTYVLILILQCKSPQPAVINKLLRSRSDLGLKIVVLKLKY